MSKEILDLALGYPYPLPAESYIVDDDVVHPMTAEAAPQHRDGRTPVLAVGSNQSPQQIIRKFAGMGLPPIPCERCVVHDFDSVYSAHVTGYGSIASCLHPSPGTRVTLFVNWLHDDHMERMHATELGNENYAYAQLHGIRIDTEFGLSLDKVYFYCSNAGAYVPDGVPVPLAEIPAENRQWPARSQREMLAAAQARTAPGHSLESYILSSTQDVETRNGRKASMRRQAIRFAHSGLSVIKT